MIEDSVILYDRDRFSRGVLLKLDQRLKELGARKLTRGNAWYWDLKPDYRPGQEIKLW